jgi:hypothetical protein
VIVAIDPGKQGGWACFENSKYQLSYNFEILKDFLKTKPPSCKVFVECIQGGSYLSGGKDSFLIQGANIGYWRGFCEALGIDCIPVFNSEWTKEFPVLTKNKSAKEKKKQRHESYFFPRVKSDTEDFKKSCWEGARDAYLIGVYVSRQVVRGKFDEMKKQEFHKTFKQSRKKTCKK